MSKQLNKTQVYNNVVDQVQELLSNSKVTKTFSSELLSILETNLAPKSSGSINPPILDEDGNIVEAYCRFHKRYEVVSDMVISQGKSKGYCKASISLWNKTNSAIKALDSKATKCVLDGDFENAKEVAQEAQDLKAKLNAPDFYDYDRDWAAFND